MVDLGQGDKAGMPVGAGSEAPELLEIFSVTQRSSACDPYALL